jgi:hypothetical protein
VPLTDHTVTARLPLPHLIVRGVDTLLQCPLYAGASLVPVVDGTCTVVDAGQTTVASGPVVVDADGVAAFTVDGTDTADLDPGDGWSVAWSLETADDTHTPRSDAALVRTLLYPVVADVDLFRRVPALDPSATAPITEYTTYQGFLDEAWTEIERRLLEEGRRPWLVLAPGQLRSVHLYTTLALVFEDQASRLNLAWETRAQDYRAQATAAWDRLVLRYDQDDDGADDDGPAQPAALATVFLSGRR